MYRPDSVYILARFLHPSDYHYIPWWFGRELNTTLSLAGAARQIFLGQVAVAIPHYGGRGTYGMERDVPAERHDRNITNEGG